MAKKTVRRKKTKNDNSFFKLVIIVLALAIISVVAAYSLIQKDISNPLDGTWVSNYDGAMLSIKGGEFSIEMPSVDASSTVKGRIMIEKTIATFINSNGIENCKGVEGHYSFSFEDDELQFNIIKDYCSKRKLRMTESWFKL